MLCPVTNPRRDFPFHVPLPEETSVTGFVMVEQVKSIDCRARRVKFIEACSAATLADVLAILDAVIY